MSLSLSQFSYHLPDERIAHTPIEPRDHSKLLVLDKETGSSDHKHFYDLPDLLDENVVLVRNNTKVLPARLYGKKETGGAIEILLNKREALTKDSETWQVLTKPGLKLGQTIHFENSTLTAECVEVEEYTRLVRFNQGGQQLFDSLYQIGHTPIPPYIHWDEQDEQHLRERYQTLYAKHEGSAAAPTAGLHFTKELDEQLISNGVQIEEVTLHVGLGTFLPVKDDDITHHHMHAEQMELTKDVADRLNQAKKLGKKILAVGTTTTRLLESCVNAQGELEPSQSDTSIYIYPPYEYKFVDQIITNFHLPESTLLMMISAFISQPNTNNTFETFEKSVIGKAYQEAIQNEYRFYSFGDGMLLR